MRRCEEETQVPKVARHYFDKNDDNRDNSKDYDDKFSHILISLTLYFYHYLIIWNPRVH